MIDGVYISKQKAKDLMGCCLAIAKAKSKDETFAFKKEQFKHYAETIEAMIDVVGSVESADVQPVKHGKWIDIHEWCKMHNRKPSGIGFYYWCSECEKAEPKISDYCPNCGAIMDGDKND